MLYFIFRVRGTNQTINGRFAQLCLKEVLHSVDSHGFIKIINCDSMIPSCLLYKTAAKYWIMMLYLDEKSMTRDIWRASTEFVINNPLLARLPFIIIMYRNIVDTTNIFIFGVMHTLNCYNLVFCSCVDYFIASHRNSTFKLPFTWILLFSINNSHFCFQKNLTFSKERIGKSIPIGELHYVACK